MQRKLFLLIVLQVNLIHAWTFSEIIFGPLWKFDEYCSDVRSGPEVVEDAETFNKFYNGTALKSLGRLDQLDSLRHDGVKSRYFINKICSINSWGYADEETLNLSNEPFDDKFQCRILVDKLYKSIELIRNTSSRTSCRADYLSHPLMDSPIIKAILPYNNGTEYELASILQDWIQHSTFGRVPPGPPYQSHIWIGDYKGCLKIPNTRFCYGAYSKLNHNNAGTIPSYQMYPFRIGICLPRSCDSSIVLSGQLMVKLDSLIKDNMISNLELADSTYKLTDVHCPPALDSSYRSFFRNPSSDLFILAALLWLILLIAGSMNLFNLRQQYKILRTFDVRFNWKSFKQAKCEAPELAGLNFIKIIMSIFLISAHAFLLNYDYVKNLQDMRLRGLDGLLGFMFFQAQHGISAYFMISGLLVGYKHLGKKMDVLWFVINRYSRLAPMYLVVYAFVKKFGHLLSHGPYWDYGVSLQSEARQCHLESWFVPTLMLANFISPFSHCVLTGWHVANDFQIYILLPILLYFYGKSRKIGRSMVLSAFTLSHCYHYWNFYTSSSVSFFEMAQETFLFGGRQIIGHQAYDYINPIGRIGTYFMGVLLADLLIEPKEKSDHIELESSLEGASQSKNLSSVHQEVDKQNKLICDEKAIISAGFKDKLLLAVGYGLFMVAVESSFLPYSVKFLAGKHSRWFGYPTVRVVADLGCFLTLYYYFRVLNCNNKSRKLQTSGQQDEKRVQRSNHLEFVKLPTWSIVVKLNYTLILTHFTVQRYVIQSQTQLLEFSWINYFQLNTFLIVLEYLVSLVAHLAIEMPLTSLVKQLLSNWEAKKRNSASSR